MGGKMLMSALNGVFKIFECHLTCCHLGLLTNTRKKGFHAVSNHCDTLKCNKHCAVQVLQILSSADTLDTLPGD